MDSIAVAAVVQEVAAGSHSKSRSKKPRRKHPGASSIDRFDRRAALEPWSAPYWKRTSEGRYIGFRKMKRGAIGTWLARAWSDAEKRYNQKPLDVPADLPEGEKYDVALALAQLWFDHLDHGGNTKAVIVKDACEAYVAERKVKGKASAAKSAAGTFDRIVYGDAIAGIELSKLTANACAAWRQRVEAALMKRGSKNPKGSVNRSLVPLVAALNLALRRRTGDVVTRPDFTIRKSRKHLPAHSAYPARARVGRRAHPRRRADLGAGLASDRTPLCREHPAGHRWRRAYRLVRLGRRACRPRLRKGTLTFIQS